MFDIGIKNIYSYLYNRFKNQSPSLERNYRCRRRKIEKHTKSCWQSVRANAVLVNRHFNWCVGDKKMYRGLDALSAFPRRASGYVRWQRVHPAMAAWKRRFHRYSESTYHRIEISITRNTCHFHACSCRAIRVTFPATADVFTVESDHGTRCNYIVWPVRHYLTTSNEIRAHRRGAEKM